MWDKERIKRRKSIIRKEGKGEAGETDHSAMGTKPSKKDHLACKGKRKREINSIEQPRRLGQRLNMGKLT